MLNLSILKNQEISHFEVWVLLTALGPGVLARRRPVRTQLWLFTISGVVSLAPSMPHTPVPRWQERGPDDGGQNFLPDPLLV